MVLRPLSSRAALLVSTASAALLVSGCRTQAQETPAPKPKERPNVVHPILPKAKTKSTSAKGQQDGPKEGAETAPAEPAKTYKVTNPTLGPAAPAQAAADYAAAIKKVALPPPPADFNVPEHPRVELDTPKGKMVLELDATKAPLTVKSFVYLASKGFYKNTVFHRRADLTGDGEGYIIQGGDPLSAEPRTFRFAGTGGPSYSVPLEISDLTHDQFVIAAARSNDPDSAGSQFYITQGAPHFLDGQYTVFGKIVEGKDVAAKLVLGDKLQEVKVLEAPKAEDAPKTP